MVTKEVPSFYQEQSHPSEYPRILIFPSRERFTNVWGANFEDQYFNVVFLPRNSLPVLADNDKRQYIFLQRSPWINERTWTRFNTGLNSRTLLMTSTTEEVDLRKLWYSLVYIEASPASLVNAARFLDPKNHSLRELYNSFSQPIKPAVYDEFIDLILAGKFINSKGSLKKVPDFEGEMLMLATLVGDRKSAEELARRKYILQNRDQATHPSVQFDQNAQASTGLGIKNLVAVHSTNYLPYVDNSGVYIRSSFDGSNEVDPRLSIHFALNHHVVSHKMGNWDENPYVLIAPLQDLIDLNGPPTSLRPEDTYFTTSPGMPLKIPLSSKLLIPREFRNYAIPLDSHRYGQKNFSKEELDLISTNWPNLFWDSKRLRDAQYHREVWWKGYTFPGRWSSLEGLVRARLIGARQENRERYFYESSPRLLYRAGINLAKTAIGEMKRIVGPKGDALDKFIDTLLPAYPSPDEMGAYSAIRKDLEDLLGPINKTIVVERAVTDLGYKLVHIDPYYLENEDYNIEEAEIPPFVSEVLELAERAGISSVRHPKTVEGDQDQLLHTIKKAASGIYEHMTYCERKKMLVDCQKWVREAFLDINQQYRRMIYLTGTYHIGDFTTLL